MEAIAEPDAASAGTALMAGRRGVVMGVANERSIAYGIAAAVAAQGACLAFTYQGETFGRRVVPLAEALGSELAVSCDVEDTASVRAAFEGAAAAMGGIDFVVHAVAYSAKEELKGSYLRTSAENFRRTMLISCYSFTRVAQEAERFMGPGGALLTLSYIGAERVIPNYNLMGVAKAALEASVRYLAVDLGPRGIRVNAISAGPVKTLAGSAIAGARDIYRTAEANAPLRRNPGLEEIGRTALYLLSDLASGVTGEIVHVDGGFHALGMAYRPGEPSGNGANSIG